ncbi:MAG: hypothetical protein DRG36_03325 [Deltaproteobacteria bacterium]|nr:MAG: hypothetical protein DRG36_03325 [Deltaproteobacteria bacterium]
MTFRLLLALVLSILVMVLYQWWYTEKYLKGRPRPQKAVSRPLKRESPPQPLPRVEEVKGTYGEVKVSTPLYDAIFSLYGARLKEWRLKAYKDRIELHPLGKWVQRVITHLMGRRFREPPPPEPVNLVEEKDVGLLPLGLRFPGGEIPYDEHISWECPEREVELSRGEAKLRFLWHSPHGGTLIKEYTFHAESYRVDLKVIWKDGGSSDAVAELAWVGEAKGKAGYYRFYGPIYFSSGKVEKVKPKALKKGPLKVKEVQWLAFDQGYFTSLICPIMGKGTAAIAPVKGKVVSVSLLSRAEREGGEGLQWTYTLFLGPKIPELLAQVTPTAKKLVDYGTFSIIAVPILKLMKLTHKFTGNYGLDIIILAVLLKILFTPLTLKSQKAMKELQKLQPEIKRLQQKYKGDKERLNREILELYRRRKINPFGGCLPLLLQIPVFFALYRALLASIELRHAPFVLWLRDLSDKDPTYITPLLMGATMFIQQKMTTPPTDPTQGKMMTFMPIIFTFIFLNFPSGLVLYWLVTNLLGILHQLYIERKA